MLSHRGSDDEAEFESRVHRNLGDWHDKGGMQGSASGPAWGTPNDSLHHHPAIHRQRLPGDVFRFRRGEEGNRSRNVRAFTKFA